MEKIKSLIINSIFSIKITYRAAKKYFIIKTILVFGCSILPFINIYFWKKIIDCLTSTSSYNRLNHLLHYFGLYVLVYLVTAYVKRVSQYVDYKYNDRVNLYVENLLLDKFSEVDLAFYDSSKYSDKLSYTWKIKSSLTLLATILFYSVQVIVTFFLSLSLLAQLDTVYVLLIVLFTIPTLILKFKINHLNNEFTKKNSNINRRIAYFKNLFRNVNCMYDIKIYNLKDYFIGQYTSTWSLLYKRRKELTGKVTFLTFLSLLISSFVNQILLYAIIIYKLNNKRIQIGDATYYISIFNQFYTSTMGLINTAGNIQRAFQQLVSVREFVEMEPMIQKSGTLVPKSFERITFSHVYFKYPNKTDYVLKDCSFTIKRGQTVGLVGENGSGKSTIVKLLLRLYDVEKGQILLDDIDIRQYDISMYRTIFSALFQDFIAYSFTLRENIALSDFDSCMNDERINDAIKKSELENIVSSWDKGLDTPLTREFEPAGKELSGGQWQRIALARVFFSDRQFIVLDEPSASLDVFAEEKIFNEFKHLSNNRSSIIISHRLSSIVNADIILVLKDGNIVEKGTHKELMQNNNYYAELFNLQASRYL